MTWIYLSPHFDDVALSCGGLVWEQGQAGECTQVWTICAGEVPPGSLSPFAELLHSRWKTAQNAPAERRLEDLAACRAMQAVPRHFDLPDAIYRRGPDEATHLYASEEGIFGSLHPAEEDLVRKLAESLKSLIPAEDTLVSPLTLGGHVDHRLTRAAAEKINRPMWYYADYPYVLTLTSQLESLSQSGWQTADFPVSEAGLEAWIASIAAYASQLSTFWPDAPTMRKSMRDFWQSMNGGIRLWRQGR